MANVSSLANAGGGDLIFGVEEAGGMAAAIPGVTVVDAHAERLRLLSSIRERIAPRLVGVDIAVV